MAKDDPNAFVSKLQSLVIIAIFVVGVLCLGVGFAVTDRLMAGTFQAVGGALLGAAASILLAAILEKPAIVQVKDTLIATLGSKLLSNHTDLEKLRRRWHLYHLTTSDGIPVWRYKVIELGFDTSLNSLATRFEVADPRTPGKFHSYRLEAGVRERRALMLQSRLEGGEDEVIYVYPKMAAGFVKMAAGYAFMESWDGKQLMTKTLMAAEPLIPQVKAGTVPAAKAAVLDASWASGVSDITALMDPSRS